MDVTLARALLGVAPGAHPDEVERAFRALARKEHPDHGGDADRFQLLVEARDLLRRAPRRDAVPIRDEGTAYWRPLDARRPSRPPRSA